MKIFLQIILQWKAFFYSNRTGKSKSNTPSHDKDDWTTEQTKPHHPPFTYEDTSQVPATNYDFY